MGNHKLQPVSVALALIASLLPAPIATAAVSFSVTPAAVSNTYSGYVSLQIGGLTNSETVVVQKFLDLNTNGLIDGSDWLVGQFTLTDGQAGMVIGGVTNFNVPGDTDGMTNGQITAALNFQNGDISQNIIGDYLFKLSSPGGHFAPIINHFAVTNPPYAQEITGSVVVNGTGITVPNAVVVLTASGPENALAGVVANDAGSYAIQVPPGAYVPLVAGGNYVFDYNAAPTLTLTNGQTITTNLVLINATGSISGKVVDSDTGVGLPGVIESSASDPNGLIAVAFTDDNGNFNLPVTAGAWEVGSKDDEALNVHGAVGRVSGTIVSSGETGVTLAYPEATALFYGSLKDPLGNPLAGIELDAYDADGQYKSFGDTDMDGNYVIGVVGGLSSDPWWVDVDSAPTNMIFSEAGLDENGGTNLGGGQSVLVNFTGVFIFTTNGGTFQYAIDEGAITITGYSGLIGAVIIPSVINGLPVTGIESNAFEESSLTSVTIPDSVTSIGSDAFNDCSSLTSATIPGSITNFFEVFGYSPITSVTFDNGATSIGEDMFLYDNSLTNITIPNSVTNIGDGAFFDGTGLTRVTIPNSVANIGDEAFEYCTNLASVTMSDSLTNIGSLAFYMCQRLTNVTIPGSVITIGDDAFLDCADLTSVTIENGVPSIGPEVFENCVSLTNVTIPESVTNIGSDAFNSCISLTSMTIPGSVTSIGDGVFAYCMNLTSVTIDMGVTSIGANEFFDCSRLSSVSIPDTVTSIGDGAFGFCTSLSSITIPNSVTNIGDDAFDSCNSLTSVYCEGNAPPTNQFVFYVDDNATIYYLSGSTGWPSTFSGVPSKALTAIQITASPTNGVAPLKVNFTAADVDSNGHTVTNRNWDFGDGSTSTAQNPSHTYTTAGAFCAALIETNSNGVLIGGACASISVSAPTIAFTADPTHGFTPLTVSFTSGDVDSTGHAITGWNWNFGDGSIGSGQNPSHTYTTNGVFQPGLIATNSLGVAVIGIGPASISCSPFALVYDFSALSGFPSYSNSDGASLYGGLVLSGNTLYGTANAGGHAGSGTLFAVNTDGSGFTNLHSFTNGADGANPYAGLILSGNTLYGTATEGGSNGYGTVFAVNTNGGGFMVLHSFTALDTNTYTTNSDGANPYAGLILSGNTLYGTADYGGTNGRGTVFAVNTDGGDFMVLHSFTAVDTNAFTNTDGANPCAGLLQSGNTLYGTAENGGSNGYGTVFAVNTEGEGFIVLHSFTDGGDGAFPEGSLILSGATLYGTASHGGDTNGDGTVFSLNITGTGFETLYEFTGGSDGANPVAGLTLSGNILYGTASEGGTNNDGAVYAVEVPVGPMIPGQPDIVSVSVSGTNLALNAINGQSGATYYVLMSTNLDLALSQWTPVATNVLSTNGNFTITATNTVARTIAQRYYILEVQ
jgi:uncharacterized repeat protein (TIGR03803 family)